MKPGRPAPGGVRREQIAPRPGTKMLARLGLSRYGTRGACPISGRSLCGAAKSAVSDGPRVFLHPYSSVRRQAVLAWATWQTIMVIVLAAIIVFLMVLKKKQG